METDKRPFYNWIMVLLLNIGMVSLITSLSLSGCDTMSSSSCLFTEWNFIIIGVSIFVSVVPALISHSNNIFLGKFFGYGVPALMLLLLIYYVYDYFTCTGKLCDLAAFVYGSIVGLATLFFMFFYAICTYSKKWNSKFVLFLSLVIPILIVGGFWFYIKH